MKCTFYRPETISTEEWDSIRSKLRADLDELETGKVPESEVIQYLEDLLLQAEPLERDPAMRFLGFDRPEHMPSDIRVEYYYWPTYLAAALSMKACLLYPGILEKVSLPRGESAREILCAVLLGCTGRGFRGHGFDDVRGLVEVTEFFVDHGARDFIETCGCPCTEFTECFTLALLFLLHGVMSGKVAGAWGDDYTDRAYDILEKAKMFTPEEEEPVEEERLYLAYGSNLNLAQMQHRCPDAHVVGTAELPGWRLMYKGSRSGNYLTIEQAEGHAVPVAVWAVSDNDERNLDHYEGFPIFYYKKELSVTLHEAESGISRQVKAFVYIMHEDRKLGLPRADYVERCAEGYKAFGFDTALLNEAYQYSSGFETPLPERKRTNACLL